MSLVKISYDCLDWFLKTNERRRVDISMKNDETPIINLEYIKKIYLNLSELPAKNDIKDLHNSQAINTELWSPKKHIGLPYSIATAKHLNLAAVNTNRATFDVLDVKFIYNKPGEKDQNANYRRLKMNLYVRFILPTQHV